MKVKKINQEFMKLYYKGKNIVYDEEDDYILVSDSYRIYKMKKEDFILDINKFKRINLKQFLDDTGYVKGLITNGLYTDDKYDLRLITGKDELMNIKVNNKYLDFFDNPEVKIKNEVSPVLLYENDEIVGLVLSIREY